MTDISEASDFLDNQRQVGLGQAVTSVDDDPDAAARAIQIGKASGVPPIVVHDDLEGYEAQHKAALTHDILRNNPYLQAYAAHDPMAAKVSNDDWGQLDKVHQVLDKYNSAMKTLGLDNTVLFGMGPKLLPETLKTIKEGLQGMITAPQKILGLTEPEDAEGLGAKTEAKATELGASPEQAKQIARTALERHQRGEGMTGALFGIPTIIGAPVIAAFKEFISKPLEGATGFPAETAEGLAFAALAALGIRHAGDMGKSAQQAHDAITKAEPYMQAGKPTPPGLDPTIDKMHIEQSKQDLKSLDDLLKESQKSTTRERAPEYYEKVLALKDQGTIGISADAVAKLYGDKLPKPDDNVLGWIPDLEKQMYLALSSGGDIEVPIAKWATYVDPEIAKQLHDDIRPRKGGVTKVEGKVLKQQFAEGDDTPGPAQAFRDVYEQIKQEQGGIGTVYIGDIIERTGLPKEVVHEALMESQRRDELTLHGSSAAWAKRTKAQQEGAFPGEEGKPDDTRTSTVVFKDKNEQAVANVRTAAKLDPLFEEPIKQELRTKTRLEATGDIIATVKDTYTENEQKIIAEVDAVIKRIGGEGVDIQPAIRLETAGRKVEGAFTAFTKTRPIIQWSLKSSDPTWTGRHETMHYLREYGFFKESEWDTLVAAAMDEDWLKKHDIEERYSHLPKERQFEEAIAEEFPHWVKRGEMEGAVGKVFQKIMQFLNDIKAAVARALGHEPTYDELFAATESGALRERGPQQEPLTGSFKQEMQEGKQGELDVTRQEDKKLFATIAGWMNKAQQAKYMDLIAKRNAEDADFQLKKAERLERKRQSEEWKQDEAEMRPEVEKDVRDRPDMQALEFFRSGKLYGEETGTRPRVDPSKLTEEQRKAFPEKYQRRDGMNPSDVANLFGYTSFDELAAKLTQRDTELGSKTTAQFLKGIVDKELEQRMLAEYGDKEENILREAQEHVVSPTQMDLLHEETVALGMKIGSEMTFTKADFKAWVQDKFKDAKAASISVENFLRDAGKVGREVEAALLEDKPTDAFKGKQRQLMSLMLADEAIKFEKDQGRLEKLAKRFSSREVAGVLPEYTNFVHDILQRIGEPVRRSVQDLAEAIGNSGFKDISHFVDSKEADLREVPVADFLLDPNFRKPLKDMTVDEYRAVLKSIQALVHNGRNELKIIREGEEADLQSVKDGMREQLEIFPEKHIDVTGKPKQGFKHAMRTAWASLLQIEALFNRWDKGDRNGLFTKYISLPLADASNNFASLERKYGAKLRELKDKVDLSEGVDNTIFREPTAGGFGELMQFNRGNLRAILRYAGRPQAFEKLAKGYGLDPAQITDWLNRHATKEDWDWASKQGKIFDEVFEEASKMYTRLTGVAPEKSDVAPVQTPFGTYDGWYHPIDYDSRFPGPSKKLMGGDSLEQKNYVRATTPAGYTKKVTGYNAPLSLDIANTAEHMRGMLHDISYREAVIEASKIFYDHSFQRTVNKHYGLEYQKLLVPYLRDVANLANFRSDAQATGARVSEFLRQNIIGTLIGFNPGTVLKHGATAWINSMNEVGSVRFLEAVKDMFQRDEVTGDRNWSFALEHSEELQRRHRNYIDTMRGGEGEALGETSWRETMLRGGAWTVSKADLASAVPTWLAEYRHSMEEGSSHGEAISDGNRAVRRAHGSSVITNRPAAMRGGQAAQWMTSLYGFFSHMLNKQFEMMWRARETIGKFSEGEYQEAAKDLPQLSSMFFSYVIFPALIEELVTPLTSDEHESWAAWTGKTLAKGVSSSWPIIRDVAHAALSLHNTEPSVGLFTSSLKTAIDVTRDMKDTKRSFSKERAGKTLQHGITAFGALTGLTNQQEGRVANFMYNMSTGQEKPKGPWQFAVGMRFGQTKGHSKSFDDYMKSLVGDRR